MAKAKKAAIAAAAVVQVYHRGDTWNIRVKDAAGVVIRHDTTDTKTKAVAMAKEWGDAEISVGTKD